MLHIYLLIAVSYLGYFYFQYFQTWQDLKNCAKAKGAAIKRYRNQTGGGPQLAPENDLSNEEEQILNTIGLAAIEGHPDVLESNTTFDLEHSNFDFVPDIQTVVIEAGN